MEHLQSHLNKIKVYSSEHSREAYVIRDFLKRSVVTYEWINVDEPGNYQALLKEDLPKNLQFPVVELPSGKLLFSPTIAEIASELGWVSKPKHWEYDVSIFGGGPAGLSAAVYAASEGLSTVLIEREAIGGQAGTSSRIENYLGFPNGITGADLAERARQQAVKFGVEILLIRMGQHAEFIDNKLHVDLIDGSKIIAKSNICATGVQYARLNLPEEAAYLNAGVYYGAGSSEATMCINKHIFIVGGGNSAGQAALNFSKHAEKVTIVIRGNDLSASLSYYLLSRITKKNNIEVLYNSQVTKLKGDNELEAIEITNFADAKTTTYPTTFLFVCIGGKPNTDWAKNTPVLRDKQGYLVTGNDIFQFEPREEWKPDRAPAFLETSVPGCFAAGDVRHNSIKRVASAVGEGAMAVTFIHKYLSETY